MAEANRRGGRGAAMCSPGGPSECARRQAEGRERPGHAWVGASPVGAPGVRSAELLLLRPRPAGAVPGTAEVPAEAASGDGSSKACPHPAASEERGAAVGVAAVVQPGTSRGRLGLRGSVLSPLRWKAKGNAPVHLPLLHRGTSALARAAGGPGVGKSQPPNPRRPISPAHSRRREPRRAGPGRRGKGAVEGPAGGWAPAVPPAPGQAGASWLLRTCWRSLAAALACPWIPGALPGASYDIPAWGPWWHRHPRSSPVEAEGPADRREEENNCPYSLHDASEGSQSSLFHPAGSSRERFPAAAASPLAQEGFRALSLEGGRQDHTRHPHGYEKCPP
ncbi:uncharacterized protein LOC115901347 [Camarhynchus parvulus]|uniref:uncharacterized protein LOC115901347 n=1 Tax=Geospiza parvula TaxID=87175 RepID=UPI00123816C7|nr:uncharacterized protein LOC115901347 [Camarhynchus parvulus]